MKRLENKMLKPKYPQPHSIKLPGYDEALKYHLTMKEHRRRKYNATKWYKRMLGK